MAKLQQSVFQQIFIMIGRLLIKMLFKVKIQGLEQLHPQITSFILTSNHFSWFDAPILSLMLPFRTAFLIATEAQNKWWVRLFSSAFHSIPIWRGQVDRAAMRRAVEALHTGQIVGIFPEGGVNPELAELVARGEQIPELRGNMCRRPPAQLMQAKAGVALLAIMSEAKIVPVGLLGTEQTLANLRRWRRTAVTVQIGPAIGPLTVDPLLSGRQRRQALDALAHQVMYHIAALLPLDKQGFYAASKQE